MLDDYGDFARAILTRARTLALNDSAENRALGMEIRANSALVTRASNVEYDSTGEPIVLFRFGAEGGGFGNSRMRR